MTVTDTLTLILCFFLLWRGSGRGFIGSLLGPLALIVASIISFVYFILTKNLPISLCIGLFGPFILAWILRLLVRSFTKITNPEGQINFISRLSGALLTLAWGLVIYVITLLLLAMMPPFNKTLELMYKDIHLSRTYHVIKPLDFYAMEDFTSQDDLKSLSEDKSIQDIINDPKIIDAIQNKDYASVASNPKIMKLIQDPKLMKKMMAIYKNTLQEKLPN